LVGDIWIWYLIFDFDFLLPLEWSKFNMIRPQIIFCLDSLKFIGV
jgi:hypothetical protein